MEPISVAIIAGGKSSRMGRDKAFVLLDGKPMIEHVLFRVRTLDPSQLMIITNNPEAYTYLEVPLHGDVLPGKGALGGILTALHYSPTDYVLAIACDMPFVNPALLKMLAACLEETPEPVDAVVPCFGGRPQGLHAIYRRSCLEPIRANLEAGQLKVISFYDQVNVRFVEPQEFREIDPEGMSFKNINTPEELRSFQRDQFDTGA